MIVKTRIVIEFITNSEDDNYDIVEKIENILEEEKISKIKTYIINGETETL